MMKLSIDRVLDFVADGETDPAIKAQLELDPQGLEMLQQARLLREMLRRHAKGGDEDGRPGIAEGPDPAVDQLREPMPVRSLHRAAPPSNAGLLRLQQAARASIRQTTKLGMLTIRRKSEGLAFKPEGVFEQPGLAGAQLSTSGTPGGLPAEKRSTVGDTWDQGIEVRGSGLEIILQLEPAAGLELRLKVCNELGLPARRLDITYVPERGPFSRARTDLKGIATLAVPEVDGILRFESEQAQQLDIRIED